MSKHLHLDVETFSSEDLFKAGAYKYTASPDFEILMIAYAFDNGPVEIISLAEGEEIPHELAYALRNKKIKKHAHNATFERLCFAQYGYDIPAEEWVCTMIKAAYCGLPLSLEKVGEALNFSEELQKNKRGKALIRYFCVPCKPTKVNGGRTRNLWHHDVDKWEEFKQYCITDVASEREVENQLKNYSIPKWEIQNYVLDQKINDTGVLVDLDFAESAIHVDSISSELLRGKLIELTGLENPNSPAQLKAWLSEELGEEVKSLNKVHLAKMLSEVEPGIVLDVLTLRSKAAKTSIKKYAAMLACSGDDSRARGLFQFQGANRTGRWAGRLIQLQNLPRNYIRLLALTRGIVKERDTWLLNCLYSNTPKILSELIRTAFVAPPGHIFAVADFSAIEARVIAWLAREKWRLDIFNTHGKIYEASASMMFNVPIEEITKGSDLRQRGKVAELSLGYQGSVGALTNMGGERMGLSKVEMKGIVKRWRTVNKKIVELWEELNDNAFTCIENPGVTIKSKAQGLLFHSNGKVMTIELPSGRKLFYQKPHIGPSRFGGQTVAYYGTNQVTRKWSVIDTYGGKLAENIVQAIARDLLAYSMQALDREGYSIVMHVHDEAVAEVPKDGNEREHLNTMNKIMGTPVPWAPGLPLEADGYLTPFYKKD